MAILAVVRYPAPVLKTRATELVPGATAEALAQDLVDTMRASPGCVGLAAPQIGVGARAFALDVTGHKKARSCAGLIVMINPIVIEQHGDPGSDPGGGNEIGREGCMSLPDFTGSVRRAQHVIIEGLTPSGEKLRLQADAFEARAFQHEIDHLDGLLFVDRVSSMTADIFPRKRYR